MTEGPSLADEDGAPPLASSWEVPVPLAAGAPPLAGLVSGVTDEPAPLPWEPRASVPRGRTAALGAAG